MKAIVPSILCAIAGFAAGYGVFGMSGKTDHSSDAPQAPTAAVDAPAQPKATASPEQAPEIRNIAQPLLNNIMDALDKGEFKQFTKDFQPELMGGVTEQAFKMARELVRNPQGKIDTPHWIGAYRKGTTIVTMWKLKDNKGDGDILVNLSLLSLDQHIRVIGFYLQ